MHEEIKTTIVELVETLVEQTTQVMHYSDQIPPIEIDLVMSNLQQLYGQYIKLSKLNQSVIQPLPFIAPPVVQEVVKEEIAPVVQEEIVPVVEEIVPITEVILKESVSVEAPKEVVKKPSIAERMQQRMHASLKSAIGINERYAFSKFLFKENTTEYHAVIDAIDQQPTYEEALLVIAPYQEKYHWETNQEVWDTFMQLVQNKYGK